MAFFSPSVQGGYTPKLERVPKYMKGDQHYSASGTWLTILDITGVAGALDFLKASNTGTRKYRYTVDGQVFEDGGQTSSTGVLIGPDCDLQVSQFALMNKSITPIFFNESFKLEVYRGSGGITTTYQYRTF